jgi:ATP-dependent Lon protease
MISGPNPNEAILSKVQPNRHIANASLAFVGNIDQSVHQIVRSSEHDLFLPLPPEFDLAVMDRFACYLPGWEMPKTSSAYLTERFGLITDYLAEAFHYQLKHNNRYEEVSSRVKLGSNVEGRDEKGIKKTLCAFLKILHPDGPPSDEEFFEYVSYAVECRRRVKEQMNKRKPDDEFALIDLSYFNAQGNEVIVHCPETKGVAATLEPTRRTLSGKSAKTEPVAEKKSGSTPPQDTPAIPDPKSIEADTPEERHYTIAYGDVGYTYDTIIGPYLGNAKLVAIEDPYIRAPHQISNFVRFCETVVKSPTVREIHLLTGYDEKTDLSSVNAKLEELQQSLLERDVVLNVQIDSNIHDREIRIDDSWVIKIGRGLDFYQKPEGWSTIGANDFSLRPCLETKVDVYRK